MPTRPSAGSRIRRGPHRSSQSRTRFQCASGSRPRRPGSPEECPRGRWTDSSGVRCRPGSGDKPPTGPHQASPPGYPHPLGAEPIDTRPLASLGHRDLPPCGRRQRLTAPRQGLPLLTQRSGFAGTPVALVRRIGPVGSSGKPSYRDARPKRSTFPRTRCPPAASATSRRRISSHPLCAEVASGLAHSSISSANSVLRRVPVGPPALPPSHNAPLPSPFLRQIQPLVHQRPSPGPHVGQKHPCLAVDHLPQRPAVLPDHSHRTSFPAWESRCRPAPTLPGNPSTANSNTLQPVYDRVIVPGRLGEKPL